MVKKELMNIKLQMILAIIPYVQLYSAYRIEKFRQFFLLWIVVGVSTGILFYFTGEKITGISHLVGMPFYVILIRKWSREWNEQLSKDFSKTSSEDHSSHTPLGR